MQQSKTASAKMTYGREQQKNSRGVARSRIRHNPRPCKESVEFIFIFYYSLKVTDN
jgi:hypothetical protein